MDTELALVWEVCNPGSVEIPLTKYEYGFTLYYAEPELAKELFIKLLGCHHNEKV